MKKLLGGILLTLVLLAAIVNFVPAKVPPCDEYLDWCLFTYCRQAPTPDAWLACANQCVENYLDNCM